MPMRGFREDDSEDQPLHILIGPVNFERIISFFFVKEKNTHKILEKLKRKMHREF